MTKICQYILLLSLIIFSVFITHCGAGTETGNPKPETANEMLADETTLLLNSICSALGGCFESTSTTECGEALQTDTNALNEFGADTNTINSFDEVQTDIDSGAITVDTDQLIACRDAIANVSCATMEADNVFDDSNPSDFSNVFMIVPQTECGDLL